MTDSSSPVRTPSELRVGDRVVFILDSDPRQAADDPLYEPPIPAGTTGLVVKVTPDYVRVRVDDLRLAVDPVRLWREGAFPDQASNTVSCLRRL